MHKQSILLTLLLANTVTAILYPINQTNSQYTIYNNDCYFDLNSFNTFCWAIKTWNQTMQFTYGQQYTTIDNLTIKAPQTLDLNKTLDKNQSYTNSELKLNITCTPTYALVNKILAYGENVNDTLLNYSYTAPTIPSSIYNKTHYIKYDVNKITNNTQCETFNETNVTICFQLPPTINNTLNLVANTTDETYKNNYGLVVTCTSQSMTCPKPINFADTTINLDYGAQWKNDELAITINAPEKNTCTSYPQYPLELIQYLSANETNSTNCTNKISVFSPTDNVTIPVCVDQLKTICNPSEILEGRLEDCFTRYTTDLKNNYETTNKEREKIQIELNNWKEGKELAKENSKDLNDKLNFFIGTFAAMFAIIFLYVNTKKSHPIDTVEKQEETSKIEQIKKFFENITKKG